MKNVTTLKPALSRSLRALDGDWWRVLVIWILTMILRYVVCCVVVAGLDGQSVARGQSLQPAPFKAGEVLRYKVKWAFIRLGTVIIRQLPADSTDTTAYLLQMSVQSVPSLPFVDVNFINQTYITSASQSLMHETIISGKDSSERTIYRHDPANRQIVMEDHASGRLIRKESVTIEAPCYDALGLLMLSRGLIGSGLSLTLPTLNDYRINPTEVAFPDEVEEIEVTALDRPVRCRRVEGVAKWVGTSFAGMKGPFRGWISDDEAAIPLKAEVEIFLGSIVLELESYERPEWSQGSKFAHVPEKQ